MTKTRNIADLLDTNGDVVSSALDNVPASNDASALTTGTLPSARLGTVTGFTSTGIDDNATSTAITISSDERVTIDADDEKALVVHHNDGSIVRIGMNNNSTNSNEIAFDSTDFIVKPGGTERVRITSAGLVSIGNTNASSFGSLATDLVIGTTSGEHGLTIVTGTGNSARMQFSDNTSSPFRGAIEYSHGSDDLMFYTDGSQKMKITSSGNVGIGTSSPEAKLHVHVDNVNTPSTDADDLVIEKTVDTGLSILSTTTGRIFFGDASDNDVGRIMYVHTDNSMRFNTNASERMRIDSSGTVKATIFTNRTTILNTINPSPDDTNTFEIANGYIHLFRDDTATVKQLVFGKNGSEVGNITTTGSTTAYNTSSDYRLKENVVDLTNATERLKQLQPKRFNFIKDADTTVDGFIAHEVSSVVPEAVSGTHNEVKTWKEYDELPDGVSVGDNKLDENGETIPDYQGIDQSKLVPLLVKTIQELEARITTLEANNP